MLAETVTPKPTTAEPKITIENICSACGKGPCDSPCERWNDFLEKNYLLEK